MAESLDLIWIRQDLRLNDNPSLFEGGKKRCLLIFSLADLRTSDDTLSELSKAWLHGALKSFQSDLENRYKAKLILYPGTFLECVNAIRATTEIDTIHWNRSYLPNMIERDEEYKKVFKGFGIEVKTHQGNVLYEPFDVPSKGFIENFSSFQRIYCDQLNLTRSLPSPIELRAESFKGLPNTSLKDLKLVQDPQRFRDLTDYWDVSEKAGRDLLKAFIKDRLQHFEDSCEIPSVQATSKLSPYIVWGQISVRWIWETCDTAGGEEAKSFLNQLLWREFATYSLYQRPQLMAEPYSKDFIRFPWKSDQARLTAWRDGLTGYPLIDAGMRELKQTGWIHNRIRLVVSSFLVKNLGIHWQEGAAYFQATTLDADPALNIINWQLVTGCGVDSYPFSRILNPVSQGEKFDPEGIYVSHWVPELRNLPEKWIHRPWEAPLDILKKAGLTLGETYPRPFVDFNESKNWALDAFHSLNGDGELHRAG